MAMDRREVSLEQIRRFRLHAHHLDAWYPKEMALKVAGACGLQNSPPGAWEAALQNRVKNLTPVEMNHMLEEEKSLLQAWSFRGTPVVFPTRESDAFLAALVPQDGEEWIYTHGIGLALDFLGMPFEDLLALLQKVMPKMDGTMLQSKTTLDQTLAEWMTPLLPKEKRALWSEPSMYGNPTKQTVGGAVVSFLLRPCAFMGLVVFGARQGISPTFTSYKGWVGHPLAPEGNPAQKLVRKYLHCYGPATPAGLSGWLGCGPAQAKRMWQTVKDELEQVRVAGKTRYVLAVDAPLLLNPPKAERQMHLLAGHDPYLGLQDREVILADTAKQRKIWQTVANPGAILQGGEIAGMWKQRKKGKALDIEVTLWNEGGSLKKEVQALAEEYAAGLGLTIKAVTFEE